MKKLLVLFGTFTIFMSCPLFSQDIIIKNNKSEIKVKVIEIQEDLIKYKLFENIEGPLRNIQISDVFMIIYENGKRETFATAPDTKLNAAQVNSSKSIDKSSQNISQIVRPITKGNIVLGGDVYFGLLHNNGETKYVDLINDYYNYKSTGISFSLSPAFGYFILDGLVLGLSPSFSYGYGKSSSTSSLIVDESKGHSYSIGLNAFIKYYFKSCIFIGLESGFSHSISKRSSLDYKPKSNSFSISPSLGYAIFINSKISIEPCLNYLYDKSSSKSSVSDSDYLGQKLSFSVGFHIFL